MAADKSSTSSLLTSTTIYNKQSITNTSQFVREKCPAIKASIKEQLLHPTGAAVSHLSSTACSHHDATKRTMEFQIMILHYNSILPYVRGLATTINSKHIRLTYLPACSLGAVVLASNSELLINNYRNVVHAIQSCTLLYNLRIFD